LSGCDGHHIFAQFGPGPLHDGKQSVSHHERPLGDALSGFRVSSGLVLHGKREDSCAGDQRQDRQRARPRHAADAARRRRRGNRVSFPPGIMERRVIPMLVRCAQRAGHAP
jgi:hypothetical protein